MMTTSIPSTRARAAARKCSGVSAGQSVPTTIAGPRAASTAAIMRAPRSPSGCAARATPGGVVMAWNTGWWRSGATHKVTGPRAADWAVVTVCAMKRAWRLAAPSAPSTGASRVLARPGRGALARIAIATPLGLPRDIAVGSRQPGGVRAEKIRQPQPPHEENRSHHAVLFPAAPRGDDRRRDAQRRPGMLEAFRHGDVLHQRNIGKAPPERRPRHEDRLIAGRDAGYPRTHVHRGGNDGKERVRAGNADLESSPESSRPAAGPGKAIADEGVGLRRKARVRMEEQQHFAA